MDRNLVFLRHILDEIEFLKTQVQHLKFSQLKKDPVLKRASVRSLEVIGEAVKNLSTEFTVHHTQVEWKKIAGLRDRLIHHYFGVDWDIVWDVIQNQLPKLEKRIKSLLNKDVFS